MFFFRRSLRTVSELSLYNSWIRWVKRWSIDWMLVIGDDHVFETLLWNLQLILIKTGWFCITWVRRSFDSCRRGGEWGEVGECGWFFRESQKFGGMFRSLRFLWFFQFFPFFFSDFSSFSPFFPIFSDYTPMNVLFHISNISPPGLETLFTPYNKLGCFGAMEDRFKW